MRSIIVFFMAALLSNHAHAQQAVPSVKKAYRVGIFAAIYLDSVFKDNYYRYADNFPKYVVQGLDFVQGAQVALDSMTFPNARIDVTMFDVKSPGGDIDSLLFYKKLDSIDLIIGSVRDNDYLQLAAFSLGRNIPFISATYPNDAGVTGNPFLVIANSTLKAHCEAIYTYLLQNHGSDNIILCRKPGGQEDRVAGYFNKMNAPDGIPLMDIRTANISDSNFNSVKYKLDSTKKNIIICGSLDEYFGYNLSAEMASLNKTYPSTVFGMPNWDGFKSFRNKKGITGFPVYFTSPYYNNKTDSLSRMLQDVYLKKYKGVPSEYTYKGFEMTYLFTRLLSLYPDDFMNHLNDLPVKIFNNYHFKPVFNNSKSTPDYFENKHLYFLKMENGLISMAW